MVPTGTHPPKRFRSLNEDFVKLTSGQKMIAKREAEKLRETHTIYAAWSVAICQARRVGPHPDSIHATAAMVANVNASTTIHD